MIELAWPVVGLVFVLLVSLVAWRWVDTVARPIQSNLWGQNSINERIKAQQSGLAELHKLVDDNAIVSTAQIETLTHKLNTLAERTDPNLTRKPGSVGRL